MKTWTLDFLFLTTPEGELPHPPISHLHVKRCSKGEYRGYEDMILVGARCFSIGEFEAQIDRLRDELEAIRKEARRKYAEYKARQGKSK